MTVRLQQGQWSPCGATGGGGDCLILEEGQPKSSENGYLILTNTERTFRALIPGHEIWALVAALASGDADPAIMAVIRADTERYRDEMAPFTAVCPLPAGPQAVPARA